MRDFPIPDNDSCDAIYAQMQALAARHGDATVFSSCDIADGLYWAWYGEDSSISTVYCVEDNSVTVFDYDYIDNHYTPIIVYDNVI